MMTERTVEVWKQYEKLLKEAVNDNHYFGLQKLLEYESVIESIDEFKQQCSVPLIIAIENKNVCLINLLRKYNHTLPEPHVRKCKCDNCRGNKFGQIKSEMSALKALCNPIWISLTSEDPFLTIFELFRLDEAFGECNATFQKEYDDIYEENGKFCVALLDEVKSESEGATLMRYKTISIKSDCRDLSFINLASDYGQKDVVVHPVVQYFLNSKVFSEVPHWEESGGVYKALIVMMIGILYPVTTLLNIVCPSSGCSSIADFAMKPFVKFINGAASFLTFIALLIVMGATEREGIRENERPSWDEIAVFVWLLGFIFGECKQIYRNGIKAYLSNGWNWVDMGMDFFMLFSFITWIVLWAVKRGTITSYSYETTMYIADGAFCVAIILSFFRLLYLCQASSYLGLLQICLGEMMMVIFQFMFIAIIVLLSFTVAMVYLFHSSKKGRSMKKQFDDKYTNDTAIAEVFEESFYGFFSTFFTLIYVSLGVQDTSTLTNFEDGTLVHLWANILFIVYIGISMIILLNILIAMMNSSYQIIADNIHTEHLFSQTKLWMEYVGDEQTRPVPFNLIPPLKSFITCFQRVYHYFYPETNYEIAILEEEEKRCYKKVCDSLVKRYLRKEFGCSNFAEPPQANKEVENDPFIQKIEKNYEIWKQRFNSKENGDVDDIGYEGEDKFGTIRMATASV